MEPEETPSDEERRRSIRREYNRRNAQRSRQRTKEKIEGLVTQVETLEMQEASLLEHQRQLHAEVRRLEQENEELRVSTGLPSAEATTAQGAGQSLGLDQSLSVASSARRPQVDQRELFMSLLRAEQGNVAPASSSTFNSLVPSRASLLGIGDSERSWQSLLPDSSVLLGGALSNNLSSSQGQHLHLPQRATMAGALQQQQLLSTLGGSSDMGNLTTLGTSTGSGSIEDRLREMQALAILRDQGVAATTGTRNSSSVDIAHSNEIARLLQFLHQRGSGDSGSRGGDSLLGHPPGSQDGGSGPGPHRSR